MERTISGVVAPRLQREYCESSASVLADSDQTG
jgi:hypothetical protein